MEGPQVRNFARVVLLAVFLAAVGLAAFLLIRHHAEKETLATVTGLLAVIAAVISAWPALRVLELQEDASQARPTPYFDFSSRYALAQLRVKNLGGGVAYDVRLKWKSHPRNEAGEEITGLDSISVLVPQDSVSKLLGTSTGLFAKYPTMRYEGQVEFRDSNRRLVRQKFVCSADEQRSRLVHDEELPRTLFDLQQIPAELSKIGDAIQKVREGLLNVKR
jgi:hypothetical protein